MIISPFTEQSLEPDPEQSFPPPAGLGLSHLRVCLPPEQGCQDDQEPSTGGEILRIVEGAVPDFLELRKCSVFGVVVAGETI